MVPPRWLKWLVVAMLTIGAIVAALGRDPWDPDETRYLQVTRETIASRSPFFLQFNGEAYTDNLSLRGAAAEVGIAGRTSLRDRTYDQTAVVTGDLGASLGVAGAIAGGPAVGAALLLFSQIFKEPLKGVARGYYRISGPWEDPLVRKIDARELEEAAGLGAPPAPAPSADAPPTGAS